MLEYKVEGYPGNYGIKFEAKGRRLIVCFSKMSDLPDVIKMCMERINEW